MPLLPLADAVANKLLFMWQNGMLATPDRFNQDTQALYNVSLALEAELTGLLNGLQTQVTAQGATITSQGNTLGLCATTDALNTVQGSLTRQITSLQSALANFQNTVESSAAPQAAIAAVNQAWNAADGNLQTAIQNLVSSSYTQTQVNALLSGYASLASVAQQIADAAGSYATPTSVASAVGIEAARAQAVEQGLQIQVTAAGSGKVPTTFTVNNKALSGLGITLSASDVGALSVVPVATSTTIGAVKPGTGLTVAADGTLNATASGAVLYAASSAGTPTAPTVGAYRGNIAIGDGASANSGVGSTQGAVAIGTGASCAAEGSVAIGNLVSVIGVGIAIGTASVGTPTATTGANNIAIGDACTCAGSYNTVIGYSSSSAAVSNSMALGRNARANANGQLCWATGRFGANGDAQGSTFVLRAATTSATPAILYTYSSSDILSIAPQLNQCIAYEGTIVAMQQVAGGTQSAAWVVSGLVRVGSTGTSATLVAHTETPISNAPGWGLAVSVLTTTAGLVFKGTGAAGVNIRWVGNIRTAEVVYS
jgi:hypothetical protein